MAKLTTDERIKKIEDYIAKEELQIETSKARLKDLTKKLNELNESKDKVYANDFLKILSENGFTSDEQKAEFIQQIQKQLFEKKAVVPTAEKFDEEVKSNI
ncbi:MAG: hypothetical protein RR540_00020 [Oscillospiraceae bacterium]